MTVFAWLWFAFFLLVWAVGEWMGERTAPTLLLAYAPPVLMLLPAALVLLAALVGRKSRAIWPALLTLALWPFYAGWQWNTPLQAGTADEITLLSYNLAGATAGSSERLAREIAAADADIVTLQETEGVDTDLTGELLRLLPEYEYAQPGGKRELLTLSRFPIGEVQVVELPETTRHFLLTTLETPQGPLNVVNVHFSTVLVSGVLEGKVRPTQQRRETQLDMLVDLTRGMENVVVAGDFNTPPRGVMYRRLRREFVNAWDDTGKGFGYSYPSSAPVLRIDHVFARGPEPVRAEVLPAGGSDHRGLRVVLGVK